MYFTPGINFMKLDDAVPILISCSSYIILNLCSVHQIYLRMVRNCVQMMGAHFSNQIVSQKIKIMKMVSTASYIF